MILIRLFFVLFEYFLNLTLSILWSLSGKNIQKTKNNNNNEEIEKINIFPERKTDIFILRRFQIFNL